MYMKVVVYESESKKLQIGKDIEATIKGAIKYGENQLKNSFTYLKEHCCLKPKLIKLVALVSGFSETPEVSLLSEVTLVSGQISEDGNIVWMKPVTPEEDNTLFVHIEKLKKNSHTDSSQQKLFEVSGFIVDIRFSETVIEVLNNREQPLLFLDVNSSKCTIKKSA